MGEKAEEEEGERREKMRRAKGRCEAILLITVVSTGRGQWVVVDGVGSGKRERSTPLIREINAMKGPELNKYYYHLLFKKGKF